MSKTNTLQDDPVLKAIAEEEALKRRNGIQEDLQPDIPDGEHFGVRSGYWARVWDGKKIHEFKTRGGVRNTFKAPGRDKFKVNGGKVLLKGQWEGDLPASMTQRTWEDLHAPALMRKSSAIYTPHKPSHAQKPKPPGRTHAADPNRVPSRPAMPGRSAVAASAPVLPTQSPATNTYTIQSGDTLSGIAQRNNTTVGSLREINPSITDPNRIQAGASINLGREAPAAAPSSTYTIQPGDTLSSIAQRNNTTIEAVRSANPTITDPNRIQAGASITLGNTTPQPQATRAPTTTPTTPQQTQSAQYDWDTQAAFTADWEGFRDKRYLDSEGHPTIGYGSNLNAPHVQNTLKAHGVDLDYINRGGRLEEPIARKVMLSGLKQAHADARNWIGEEHFDTLPTKAQHIFTDMSYNLGATRLRGFRDTHAGILARDWEKTASEMKNSLWYRQTKRRGKAHVESIRGLGLNKHNSMVEPSSLKKAPPVKSAVIIKGNPARIEENKVTADNFYKTLSEHLEKAGYSVSFDPGEPYTEPPPADLWVGHSRGIDRLRFAPEGTNTLAVDNYLPKDHYDPETGTIRETHWQISDRLLEALQGLNKQASEDHEVVERTRPSSASYALNTAAVLAALPVGINLLGHASQRGVPKEHRQLIRAAGIGMNSPFVYGGQEGNSGAFFIPNGAVEGGGTRQKLLARTVYPGILAYNKDGWNSTGILAHELGHMMNYRDGADFSNYGRGAYDAQQLGILAGSGRAGAKISTELMEILGGGKPSASKTPSAAYKVLKTLSRKRYLPFAAAAALTPYAPTLKEETHASHRGGKLLAEHTGNPLDYFKSFAGLPTYYIPPLIAGAAYAAIPEALNVGPAAAHLIKRIIRRGR